MKYIIFYLGSYLKQDFNRNPECWTNQISNAAEFTSFEIRMIKSTFFQDIDIKIYPVYYKRLLPLLYCLYKKIIDYTDISDYCAKYMSPELYKQLKKENKQFIETYLSQLEVNKNK
jgi:hypothetical protein